MVEIMEYINEILLGLEVDGLLWPAIFICGVILLLLLWFLFRGVRLWYWKVNVQVDALKDVGLKLQALEEGLKVKPDSAEPHGAPAEAPTESESEERDESITESGIKDPEPAETVKLIFELALTMANAADVVKALFDRKIPTPAEYKRSKGIGAHDISRSIGIWSRSTVLRILEDERFTGMYLSSTRCGSESR